MSEAPMTNQRFDLEERTLAFARGVIQFCRTIRADTISNELIRQTVRAAGSVGANYREANEAVSKRDFGLRIRIARKEVKEAHYWLQLLSEGQSIPNGHASNLLKEALELRNILSAIAKKC